MIIVIRKIIIVTEAGEKGFREEKEQEDKCWCRNRMRYTLLLLLLLLLFVFLLQLCHCLPMLISTKIVIITTFQCTLSSSQLKLLSFTIGFCQSKKEKGNDITYATVVVVVVVVIVIF